MSFSSSSKKRPASEPEASTSSKVAKVHPFFTKAPAAVEPSDTSSSSLRWLKPLGRPATCLYGVHLDPKPSTKVAAFDLDGTVIASLPFSAPKLEWHWWNSCVPAKLAEAVKEGYAVVIVTNQGGLKSTTLEKKWKEKIGLIAAAVPDVPFRIFAATAKDKYRKPMPGMWDELEKTFAEDGLQIDKSLSFFVGDFAGRQYPNSTKMKDHAGTDRKWALNVNIPFKTPEEYFLNKPPDSNFLLKGFHVSSLPSLPLFTPSSSPLLPDKPTQELVLFVGYPCLGKTSFFRKYFEPKGYVHVNQDTLKTRDKCVKAVQETLAAGKKCVVDNTNRDGFTRKYYLDVAAKHGVPVRCMLFTGSLELAWHNNLYRAHALPPSVAAREPPREIVPMSAFTSFQDAFEEPKLSEGFTHIKRVNWVFEGTEEEKIAWGRWLQLDEKKGD